MMQQEKKRGGENDESEINNVFGRDTYDLYETLAFYFAKTQKFNSKK